MDRGWITTAENQVLSLVHTCRKIGNVEEDEQWLVHQNLKHLLPFNDEKWVKQAIIYIFSILSMRF